MPPPSPSSARERAVELGRTMGVRGVAEQLTREGFKAGKSAVAEWLRADKAARAAVTTRRDRASSSKAPAKKLPAAEPDLDEDLDEASLADVDPEALDFADLLKLDRQVTKFLGESFRQREERRYAILARLKLEMRTALNKLRPAPKVDPATDPAALEARASVLSRLTKMITNAQATAAQRTAP